MVALPAASVIEYVFDNVPAVVFQFTTTPPPTEEPAVFVTVAVNVAVLEPDAMIVFAFVVSADI